MCIDFVCIISILIIVVQTVIVRKVIKFIINQHLSNRPELFVSACTVKMYRTYLSSVQKVSNRLTSISINTEQLHRDMSRQSTGDKFQLPKRWQGSTQSVWYVNKIIIKSRFSYLHPVKVYF